MGMFDTVRVKVPVPVPEGVRPEEFDWNAADYQTKDLDNCLGVYEISPEGRLMFLEQERTWVPSSDDFLGGHFKVDAENWKDTHYHGEIVFYTSYCEKPEYRWDYRKGSDQMSWSDILQMDGDDWWVEYKATFDQGQLRDIKIHAIEKTPIRVRLGNSKEWSEERERRNHSFPAWVVQHLKKIPGWRAAVRGSARIEQKLHDRMSRFLLRLS